MLKINKQGWLEVLLKKKINGVGGMNVVGEFLVKINKGVEGISSSNFQSVSLWGVLKG